jgi:hypothetical protein
MEHRSVTRRTVTRGAAWAAPTVLVAASVPAVAASVCVPAVTILPDSYACCGGGPNKAILLDIQFDNPNECAGPNDVICVVEVSLATAGGQQFPFNACGVPGDHVPLTLVGVQSCPATIYVTYTINGQNPVTGSIPLSNIPGGTGQECSTLRRRWPPRP